MKTTIYIIALLMTSLLMSCTSFEATKKDKDGNVSKVSGITTNGVEIMDAVNRQNIGEGQRNVLDATADAIINKSKGELAIDSSVAYAFRKLADRFEDDEGSQEAFVEAIKALALKELYSQGFQNVNSVYLRGSIQQQMFARNFSRRHNDPSINTWR